MKQLRRRVDARTVSIDGKEFTVKEIRKLYDAAKETLPGVRSSCGCGNCVAHKTLARALKVYYDS
jgi:hypothetical protein